MLPRPSSKAWSPAGIWRRAAGACKPSLIHPIRVVSRPVRPSMIDRATVLRLQHRNAISGLRSCHSCVDVARMGELYTRNFFSSPTYNSRCIDGASSAAFSAIGKCRLSARHWPSGEKALAATSSLQIFRSWLSLRVGLHKCNSRAALLPPRASDHHKLCIAPTRSRQLGSSRAGGSQSGRHPGSTTVRLQAETTKDASLTIGLHPRPSQNLSVYRARLYRRASRVVCAARATSTCLQLSPVSAAGMPQLFMYHLHVRSNDAFNKLRCPSSNNIMRSPLHQLAPMLMPETCCPPMALPSRQREAASASTDYMSAS